MYDSTNVATRVVLWTQPLGSAPGPNRAFDAPPSLYGRVVRVEHPPGVALMLSLAEVQVLQYDYSQIPQVVTDVRQVMFSSNATAFVEVPVYSDQPRGRHRPSGVARQV